MGFFDTEPYEIRRFAYPDDGRILFLPDGPGGPVYAVPDFETRDRIARRYSVMERTVTIVLAAGVLASTHFRIWYGVPLLLAAGFVLPRWLARTTVERLVEVHDPEAIQASLPRDDERTSARGLIAMLVGGLALLGMSAFFYGRDREVGEVVATAASGLGLLVASYKLWSDRRSGAITSGSHGQPSNTPIQPG
jgi:hypothetical protein